MKKKQITKISKLIFLILFIASCDFTSPTNSKILRAQEYISNQEYKKAAALYRDILDGNLSSEIKVKVCYQLGELYAIHLQDGKLATKYYSMIKTISSDPLWQIQAEEKIADINFSYLKEFETSNQSYMKLTSFIPKLKGRDLYEYRLGFGNYKLKNYDDALKIFEKIIKNQNHEYFLKSFYQSGLIYFEKKEWSRAIAIWQEYLKFEKKIDQIINVKFLMANAYEMMDELKLAYDLYYLIQAEYPNTKVIQNRLNSIYERRISRRR